MAVRQWYEELMEYTRNIKVIDTHEHLTRFEVLRDPEPDLLRDYLRQYLNRDLVSSGMTVEQLAEVRDRKQPLIKRWKILEPYWEKTGNTGYARCIRHTLKILYGIDGLCEQTIEEAADQYQTLYKSGRHYETVLKDHCRIERSILHEDTCDCDFRFFAPVFHANDWVRPTTVEEMICRTEKQGLHLHRLEDYTQALYSCMKKAKESGAVAVKCTLAYLRPLYFEKTSYSEAEKIFCEFMRFRGMDTFSGRQVPDGAFVDYMMHALCGFAGELHMPVQLHTGLLETYGGLLDNSNPMHLTNLFYEYPETRFDIFHIGYPWHLQTAALAKMFPNVFIDMCWAHIISPAASRMALNEYFDAVPLNKIMGFGGDFAFVDAVAGHLMMAKENVCAVMAEKIESGVLDVPRAEKAISMLFYQNPKELFGL